MLPENAHANIKVGSYKIPPIFDMLAKEGNISKEMMYNTYNMGIGMLLAVDAADADKTVALAEQAGEKAYIIGEIAEGEKGMSLLS